MADSLIGQSPALPGGTHQQGADVSGHAFLAPITRARSTRADAARRRNDAIAAGVVAEQLCLRAASSRRQAQALAEAYASDVRLHAERVHELAADRHSEAAQVRTRAGVGSISACRA